MNRIKFEVTDRHGLRNVFLIPDKRKPSVNGLAFFALMEDTILEFQKAVRKKLSAYCEKSKE